jgi:hypothetical protein
MKPFMESTMFRASQSTALAVFAAFTLVACSADKVTSAPGSPQLEHPNASRIVSRPWKGQCDVDAVFTSATTLTITGTCHLAHLGLASVLAYQTIVPGAVITYSNAATYTAANGDELRTTNAGIATPSATGLTLSGTETATGGTGRFANASGTAALNGAVRFTGPASTTGFYSLDGTLDY